MPTPPERTTSPSLRSGLLQGYPGANLIRAMASTVQRHSDRNSAEGEARTTRGIARAIAGGASSGLGRCIR